MSRLFFRLNPSNRDHAATSSDSLTKKTKLTVFLVVATLPFIVAWTNPFEEAIGHQHGDVYKRLWTFWRITAEENTIGFPWTTMLNAPTGGFLLDVHTLPAAVMSPLTMLLGPTFSLNLWVWLSLSFTGWMAYELFSELSIPPKIALYVACFCEIQPYLWGYPIASGVHERLSLWILPLLLLCALKVHREKGWIRWTVVGGGGLIWTSFSTPSYVVFMGIVLLCAFPLTKSKKYVSALLIWAVLTGLIFLYLKNMSQSPWSLAPQGNRFAIIGSLPMASEAATIDSLLLPFSARETEGVESGDWLLRLSYIGVIPILLSIAGAWRGSFVVRWLTGLGIAVLILALGPTVGGIINPLHWLFRWTIPTFGAIPDHFQWVGFGFILMGVGIASFLARLNSTRIMICLTAILLEWSLALPWDQLRNTAPFQENKIFLSINDGPTFSIPRQWQGRSLATPKIFHDQMQHGQPIFASVYFGVTAWDSYAPNAIGISSDWQKALNCMRLGGGKWLYVDRNGYAKREIAETAINEISAIIKPTSESREGFLFDLSELEILPLKKQALKPRTQAAEPDAVIESAKGFEENPFAMIQEKCPVSDPSLGLH